MLTYKETVEAAPIVKNVKGQYIMYIGFHDFIPDALVPMLVRTEDNRNLYIPAASYSELCRIARMFPDESFHVYVLTGEYSTDLGSHRNGYWTNFGEPNKGYAFPIYRSYVRYYNWLG
jgi:hypothetical protein